MATTNTVETFATTKISIANDKVGATSAEFERELKADPNRVEVPVAGFVDLPIFSSNINFRLEPDTTLVLFSTNASEVLHYAAAGAQLGLTVTMENGASE